MHPVICVLSTYFLTECNTDCASSVGIGRSSAADDGHTERFQLRVVVVCTLLIYICFLFLSTR
jgi:hypothetical protein